MRKQFIKKIGLFAAAAILTLACAVPSYAAKERLDTPTDLYWSSTSKDDDADYDEGTYAKWDEVEHASRYELTLYREDENGSVKTMASGITTKSNKYNFRNKMTEEGDYYFRVRAVSSSSNYSTSLWSSYSDTFYVSASAAENYVNNPADDATKAVALVRDPGWTRDEVGYWYQRGDGTYPSNGWFQDPSDSKWYYLDEQGYMKVGWIEDDGKIYYCDPTDLPYGAMVTGTILYDGVLYTFDDSGALVYTEDGRDILQ